jgi:hypothetical protein
MTAPELKPDLASMAGAVGLLIDRSGEEEEVLGSVWLIDANKVATCAHLITLYGDKLEALKVYFPAIGQSHGISQALFHPKFNRKYSSKLASDGLWDSLANMHLQNYNAVVLTLTPQLTVLGDKEKQVINQSLTVAAPQIEQGLGGNLGEIDFFLVIQTITSARKEGVIIISDTRNRPVARLFCQNGRIAHAIFRNLINELAVYQIVQRKLKGNFFFLNKPDPDWPVERAIARPPEMLLLEAHRRMDEMERFVASLGGHDAAFCRAVPWMNDGILPAEVAETARNLWPHLDGTIPIASLWQVVNVDDYAVYHALIELFKTRQIENVDDSTEFQPTKEAMPAKVEPLPLVPQIALAPGDEVDNLSVDSRRGQPRIRRGMLLGSLISDDPYHLLHNLPLLPESCGAPMFKSGAVIGMHCGALPPAPELDENEGAMQQMLWSECILECLKDGGEVELATRLSSSGAQIAKRMTLPGLPDPGNLAGNSAGTGKGITFEQALKDSAERAKANYTDAAADTSTGAPTGAAASSGISSATATGAVSKPTQAGCREVARVGCSKCGKTSLDAARFCKSCGTQLIRDVKYKSPKKVFTQAPLVVSTLIFMGAVASMLLFMLPAKPQFISTPLSYLPNAPWVLVSTYGVNKLAHEAPQWRPVPDGAPLNNNVQVYFDMKVNESCYLYVLSDLPKSHTKDAALEFPEPKSVEVMLKKGEHFTVPKETIKEGVSNGQKGFFLNGLVTGPTDTTILIASRNPLPLPGNQENLNLFFENANHILSLDRFEGGIEVPISQLAPNLFPKTVNDRPGDLIYLKRLMEKIPTD